MNEDSGNRPTPHRSVLPRIDDAVSAKSLRWMLQHEDTEHGPGANTPAAHLHERLAQRDGSEWLAARLLMPPFSPPLADPTAATSKAEHLWQRSKSCVSGAS